MRRQFTFYQKFLVLIRSILERRKTEMTLKPPSGFELVYQPSYHQIQIKSTICQTNSIMTRNCELFQSEFSVLYGRLIIKLSKICFLWTYVDQMIIQQRILFCFKFSFTIFLLVFFPLFSKFSTNILEIYEIAEIYNIHKKLFTIIIYLFNSVTTSSGFQTLLKIYTWGQRTLLALN